MEVPSSLMAPIILSDVPDAKGLSSPSSANAAEAITIARLPAHLAGVGAEFAPQLDEAQRE
jgi:galactokinase